MVDPETKIMFYKNLAESLGFLSIVIFFLGSKIGLKKPKRVAFVALISHMFIYLIASLFPNYAKLIFWIVGISALVFFVARYINRRNRPQPPSSNLEDDKDYLIY